MPSSVTDELLKTPPRRALLSTLGRPFLTSLANQAVSSGGNFVLGIYLARTMSLAHFGLYGICYGICMLYVGVGNALILTQMVVTMPDKAQAEKQAYAARMLCGVLALGAMLLVLAACAALAVRAFAPDGAAPPRLLPVVALAAALFLCTEFFVSYAYLRRREGMALAVNAITIFVLGAGLLGAHLCAIAPTAQGVLLLYALGAALASCAAYGAAALPLRQRAGALHADFADAWRHGRWALGGVGVTWAQAQTYTYTLALFLGPAGVGLANLARIFISPFSFLLPAINKIAVPRLSELRVSDPVRMRRLASALTAALALLTVLYGAVLYACFDAVAKLLLGRQVPGVAPLVAIWCLVLLFQVVRSGGALLLQMQRKFKTLTLMNLPSALVTILASAWLIGYYGQAGALAGLLAGEVVLAALVWKEIHDGASAH
jgi:O-antigen/teichoic acid export membrane protein